MGSAEELRSAFGNLASNAVRYTPDGGSDPHLLDSDGGGPQFAVTDTGIGIDQQHIARLTERFYRVDKSRSRETQGTGPGAGDRQARAAAPRRHAVDQVEAGRGQRFT